MHTAEAFVCGSSCLEVEIAIAKLRKYKSPGGFQILAEMLQLESETLMYASQKVKH
jgi:hypothetical protein